MGRVVPTVTLLLALGHATLAQVPRDAEYRVYADAPRLLLNQKHLRLIQRERERNTMRWAQFSSLVEGRAAMDEPGLAWALYGVAAKDAARCAQAVEWAEHTANPNKENDLRQMALALDWCGTTVSTARHTALAARVLAAAFSAPKTFREARTTAFAALAAAEANPERSAALLKDVVERWWRAGVARRLTDLPEPRAELLALVELLHVLLDNLQIDLRDDAKEWFAQLPARAMLGYDPVPVRDGAGEYRVFGAGDVAESTRSRAAELALVATDPNARLVQFLQGWLMQDRFLLRTPLGAPYEFLWANPYLPGLSYNHLTPYLRMGAQLWVRSSWDDDAAWFHYDGTRAELVRAAQRLKLDTAPIQLGTVRVLFAATGAEFELSGNAPREDDAKAAEQVVFVVGATPGAVFRVESPGDKPHNETADTGGIVELHFAATQRGRVRLTALRK